MIANEILYPIIFFMTTGPCVISAGAARETLFEGKADYCMIVCEYCLLFSRVHMLLLPWTSRPGGSKCASMKLARKLPLSFLIDALRASFKLIANQESTRPQATLMLSYRRLPRGFIQFLPNLTTCSAPLSEDTFGRHRWGALLEDSNLVDPASSHMLVSKTKPCMSKYKYYTAKLRMAH
jgi:hypothetical protein